jgi:hypothetical protein
MDKTARHVSPAKRAVVLRPANATEPLGSTVEPPETKRTLEVWPEALDVAKQNRRFLGRVVRLLAPEVPR